MVSTRRGSAATISDEAIADAFVRSPVPVVSVYLFGSHSEGRAHRQSDVDIGVLIPYAGPSGGRDAFEARVQITSHLIGQLHHNDVDVVILNDAPPQLSRRIVTRGRRILCTDAAADHAFVRDVQLRAADLEPFLRRTRRLKLAHLLQVRTNSSPRQE
jgi:predicted nucleotidyltransferase